MKNLGNLMKQAQAMQSKMQEFQENLKHERITGTAGAGLVEVTLDGKGEMKALKIDPSLLDGEDPTMLEDLLLAAHNDALRRKEEYVAEKMREMTGGIELPGGMQLPF